MFVYSCILTHMDHIIVMSLRNNMEWICNFNILVHRHIVPLVRHILHRRSSGGSVAVHVHGVNLMHMIFHLKNAGYVRSVRL